MRTMLKPALLLGMLYLGFFGSLALSNPRLPPRMATHFGANGQPNGWMSTSAYYRFIIVFSLGFPLFVPALCYVSRFLPSWCFNIPHRDYWLAPGRRPGVSDYLFRHSLWFACMALGFVMSIHFSTVQANRMAQAHLSILLVIASGGCFLAGTAIWGAIMMRHFNRVA